MTGRTVLRRAGVVACSTTLVALGPGLAAAESPVAFRVKDARLSRVSGLARDTAGSAYWATNDSSTPGVVFGLSAKGAVTGTLSFRARPVNVQALAVQGDRLYVADIGDPRENRAQVSVYAFSFPRANGLTVTYNAFDLRYPDGPHDAGTLLASESGRLFVVTSGSPGAVYAAPAQLSRTSTNPLAKVGEAPASVSDGTFLTGGDQIALVRPGSVDILDATTYRTLSTVPRPASPEPASLTLSLDGATLLVGGRGAHAPVYAVTVPGVGAATPTPTVSPSPTAGQPGSGSDPGADTSADPAGSSRQGTLGALGLAALVAVLAGVVVAVARRT